MTHATHNGAQESVYQAVASGARTISEIELACGLHPYTVNNHIRRLCDANRVRRLGGKPQQYVIVITTPLLGEVWK